MKSIFEENESAEKPLWNKRAVWESIDEVVSKKEKKPFVLVWFQLAAACIFLLFGFLFLKELSFSSKTAFNSNNKPKTIIRHARDTIYKIVADTEYVLQKNIIHDTLWIPANRLVIHDTITKIEEVWVEKKVENPNEIQTVKPVKKEDFQIKYTFNKPIGYYAPKSQIRFKLSNKVSYPINNETKETHIVLNR